MYNCEISTPTTRNGFKNRREASCWTGRPCSFIKYETLRPKPLISISSIFGAPLFFAKRRKISYSGKYRFCILLFGFSWKDKLDRSKGSLPCDFEHISMEGCRDFLNFSYFKFWNSALRKFEMKILKIWKSRNPFDNFPPDFCSGTNSCWWALFVSQPSKVGDRIFW